MFRISLKSRETPLDVLKNSKRFDLFFFLPQDYEDIYE
jgi:hypothetical protein